MDSDIKFEWMSYWTCPVLSYIPLISCSPPFYILFAKMRLSRLYTPNIFASVIYILTFCYRGFLWFLKKKKK